MKDFDLRSLGLGVLVAGMLFLTMEGYDLKQRVAKLEMDVASCCKDGKCPKCPSCPKCPRKGDTGEKQVTMTDHCGCKNAFCPKGCEGMDCSCKVRQ